MFGSVNEVDDIMEQGSIDYFHAIHPQSITDQELPKKLESEPTQKSSILPERLDRQFDFKSTHNISDNLMDRTVIPCSSRRRVLLFLALCTASSKSTSLKAFFNSFLYFMQSPFFICNNPYKYICTDTIASFQQVSVLPHLEDCFLFGFSQYQDYIKEVLTDSPRSSFCVLHKRVALKSLLIHGKIFVQNIFTFSVK